MRRAHAAALHSFQHQVWGRPTCALAHSPTEHAGPARSRIRNKDYQGRTALRMHLARLHRSFCKHLLVAAVARLHCIATGLPARQQQPARFLIPACRHAVPRPTMRRTSQLRTHASVHSLGRPVLRHLRAGRAHPHRGLCPHIAQYEKHRPGKRRSAGPSQGRSLGTRPPS